MKKNLSLLLLVVIVAACSNSTPTDTQTDTYIQPKEGSFFKYEVYDVDTVTHIRYPGISDTTMDTFAKTGMTYKGKSNVSMVISSNVSGAKTYYDTLYVNYESNNDISLHHGFGIGAKNWATIPIASKSSITSQLGDTTFIDAQTGKTTHNTVSLTASYSSNETITFKSQLITVIKIKQIFSFTKTSDGKTETDVWAKYMYYAPALGHKIKSETHINTHSNGGLGNWWSTDSLIDYQLK